jgi:hypothetical protein
MTLVSLERRENDTKVMITKITGTKRPGSLWWGREPLERDPGGEPCSQQ